MSFSSTTAIALTAAVLNVTIGQANSSIAATTRCVGCASGPPFAGAAAQQSVQMRMRTRAVRTLPSESVAVSLIVCVTPVHVVE